VRYCDFEFYLRELAGAMGDFGSLFPQGYYRGDAVSGRTKAYPKFARAIKRLQIIIMALTVGVSLLTNMAIGFVVVMLVYHTIRRESNTGHISQLIEP